MPVGGLRGEGDLKDGLAPRHAFGGIWNENRRLCVRGIEFSGLLGYLLRWEKWILASSLLNLADSLTDDAGFPEGFPAGGYSSRKKSGILA